MKKLISILMSAAFAVAANAQDSGSVPTIAIPSDAVSVVMGSVASVDNAAFSADNNVTTSAFMSESFAAAASYTMWNANPSLSHVPTIGVAYRFNGLSVSLGGGACLGSSYTIFNEDGASVGSFMPYDAHASVGVAYALPFGLAFGVSGKLIQSAIHPDYKALCFASDLYVAYNMKYVTATVAACNFGSPVKYAAEGTAGTLPRLLKAGVNVRPIDGLQIAVEGDYMLNNNSFMLNAAASYTIIDMISLRAGYHYSLSSVIPSYLSVGAGFKYKGFNINAAYLTASKSVSNSFCVSVGYAF